MILHIEGISSIVLSAWQLLRRFITFIKSLRP